MTKFTFEEIERLFDILGFTLSDLRELRFPIIHEERIAPKLLDELERVLHENNQIMPTLVPCTFKKVLRMLQDCCGLSKKYWCQQQESLVTTCCKALKIHRF